MFDENPSNLDEVTSQRLLRDLRAAARHVDLAPGSELAVVARGRRRQHRRRQATAATLVVALAGGTALVVQQLARTGDSSIATDDPVTTASSPATSAPVSAPASTVVDPNAITPDTVMAPATSAPGSAAGDGEVPLANVVESNLVWNVIEPDSAEAVAFLEVESGLSGVGLATAPGRSDEYRPQYWQSDDGVRWTPVDFNLPFGLAPGRTRFVDGAIYSVGTAPGVAASQPNPLIVAQSVDEGATWQQVELPIDSNAGNDQPHVRRSSAYVQPVPIDGGLLVLVNWTVDLDWGAVTEAATGSATDSFYDMTPDGFSVAEEPGCVPDYELAPVPIVEMNSIVTVAPGYGEGSGSEGECPVSRYTWDEAGVAPETVAAMLGSSMRGFVVVDGEVTEVEVPDGVSPLFGPTDESPRFASPFNDWYTFDGVQFVAVDPPTDHGGWMVGSRDGVDYSVESDAPMMNSAQRIHVRVGDEAGQTLTDWSDVAGTDVVAYQSQTAVTDAGLVMTVMTSPDPVLAAGGVEVTVDDVTIRRASLRSDFELFDDAIGQSIPLDQVFVDQMTGGLIIQNADGSTRAELSPEQFQPLLSADTGPSGDVRWLLQTSSNGTDVAVESIAELLGVDDSEISSVPRISAVGNTTVVAVTLKQRNPDGVPRQLVLVGTLKT